MFHSFETYILDCPVCDTCIDVDVHVEGTYRDCGTNFDVLRVVMPAGPASAPRKLDITALLAPEHRDRLARIACELYPELMQNRRDVELEFAAERVRENSR